jgi:hypothetical protein
VGVCPIPVPAGLARVEALRGEVVVIEEVVVMELITAVARTRPGAAPITALGHGGHTHGLACILPAVFVLVSPIAAGRPDLRIVVFIAAAEPDAQKDRDEDHDDYRDQADYKQDHRTTQQAMAILGGASEATRP